MACGARSGLKRSRGEKLHSGLDAVKANVLLTHFGNLKWTHPDCTARMKAFFKVREFATTLICSAMAAQSVPSEEQGIKVAPLS